MSERVSGHADLGGKLSPQRLLEVIDRLFWEGTAVARADGTIHQLFPVGIPAAEGEARLFQLPKISAAYSLGISTADHRLDRRPVVTMTVSQVTVSKVGPANRSLVGSRLHIEML